MKRTRKRPAQAVHEVHDRRAAAPDIPINAVIAPVEVDDPYSGAAKVIAIRSIRTDPLGAMHARGQIGEPEFQAGRYWQYCYEQTQVGAIQAIDTSKEPVDGGGARDCLINDHQLVAARDLARAAGALETEDYRLIGWVLGDGQFIKDIAAAHGIHTDYGIKQVGRQFRAALTELSMVFGFASRPTDAPKKAKTRGWQSYDPVEQVKAHKRATQAA